MSTALSTSRANSRPSKDKHIKAQQQQMHSTKTEGPPSKVQATPEQIRLAQMISESPHGTDADFERTINQVMDVTGKSRDVVEIALHDCQNDADRAVNMLLEGNGDQGEWRETGKKKKASKTTEKKTEPIANHVDGKTDKQEDTSERERPDRERPESTSRKNRRMDSRPPRLANRGRGRERNERSDRSDNFRSDSFRNNRGGDVFENDKGENGFGTFNFRDGEFDGGRGRGRGRGRGGGRGRGRGGGSFQKNPRFDKGPQIDTWTNETAANAEKENTIGSWGDGIEDWSDDTWTGSLTETKVFTASTTVQGPPNEVPMTDSTNTIGQRLDLGALLQPKATTNDTDQSYQTAESSYITQYNQQATETIKNTIGIGSGPRASSLASQLVTSALTNHLPTTSMTMNSSPLSSSLVDQLAASNQLSSSPQSTAAVDALVSSLREGQNTNNLDNVSNALSGPHVSNTLPGQQSAVSEASQQSVLQQRPKAQRTKLPPPSKIPASAVEMPGHIMTTLDVQFGNWEYGADQSAFSFGGDSQVSSSHTSAASNSAVSSMSNHLPQPSKPSESVITSSIMTVPPQNNGTSSVISGQDQSQSPRTNMYHNSPYSTPSKKDSNSLTQNKLSPPEPIPFPPSQSDRKSSPLMVSQRTGSTSNSLQQASLSSSQDANNMKSAYSQTTQNYQSASYQSQKSGLSNTSGLSNSAGLSSSSVLSNGAGLSNSGGLSNTTGLSNTSGLSNAGVLANTTGLSNSQGLLSDTTRLSNSAGLSNSSGLSNSAGMTNSGLSNTGSLSNAAAAVLSNTERLSNSAGMSNTSGLSNPTVLSNTSTLSSSSGLSNSSVFSHAASSQPGSYPGQYQTGSNQYQSSQNQYQTGQNQFQTGQSQYHSSQNQYQNYGQSGGAFQNQTSSFTGSSSYSGGSNQPSQGSLYQTSVSNAYQSQTTPNTMYHQGNSSVQTQSNPSFLTNRDTQSAPAYQTSVTQSGSYPRDNQSGLNSGVSQSQSVYSGQTYGSSQHQNNLQNNLQNSAMSASKISETLSKMKVQDSTSIDTRQSPSQYESSTSTTTASITTTTSTASLATGTTTSPAVSSAIQITTASNSTKTTTTSSSGSKSTKAPPNLPPGVQLLGHQYIMGQAGTLPPFYGLQQPLYNYDELLLQQQRLPPLPNYNYDMAFGVPTTMTTSGREQNNIGNVPYSGSENKIGRVDAQSPIPATQQSTQSAAHQQHFINTIPYGYYYPQLGIPSAAAAAAAAAGFQYPATMFPMPPVTNTAHVGTTANTQQFPKSYGTHAYGTTNKAYEELTQGTDFGKTTYVNQTQKVSAGTGSVSSVTGAADIPGTGYGKTHTQPFEKQGFHAGTPPPFNLPMAATGTQAGPLGAPTTPYGAPFVPMMAHQPPSQLLHPQMQQDSNSVSSRSHMHSQQSTTQAKATAAKAYANTYWGTN